MTVALGRILIVDDEAQVRDVLSEYFQAQGYTVEEAADGEAALAALETTGADLVLLDIRMPGLSGIEVLRHIRRRPAAVPVIMVTANDDVEVARDTLRLGAFDYIAKPFDFAYLDRAVATGLAQGAGRGRTADEGDQLGRDLALAVFGAVRGMSAAARASTGARLEAAVVGAARAMAEARRVAADHALGELELLLEIAETLGDLPLDHRVRVAAAAAAARRAFPRPS